MVGTVQVYAKHADGQTCWIMQWSPHICLGFFWPENVLLKFIQVFISFWHFCAVVMFGDIFKWSCSDCWSTCCRNGPFSVTSSDLCCYDNTKRQSGKVYCVNRKLSDLLRPFYLNMANNSDAVTAKRWLIIAWWCLALGWGVVRQRELYLEAF